MCGLTGLGQVVLPEFVAAFDAVSRASQALRAQSAPNRINLATLPGIAQLLLAQWLPVIRDRLPDVQISVTAMETVPNLAREPFDLTLFFGRDGEMLFGPDFLLPVCRPELAQDIVSAYDLMRVPHLSDQFWPSDWRDWFARVYPEMEYSGRGPRHSLYAMAVADAVSGGGVLMGHLSLVHPLLVRGDLVPALPGRAEIEMGIGFGAARLWIGGCGRCRWCNARVVRGYRLRRGNL